MVRCIVAVDPSGNFNHGKGTTGVAVLRLHTTYLYTHSIRAKNYGSQVAYWNTIVDVVTQVEGAFVVLENFRLHPAKAKAQSGQRLETAELLGVLEYNLRQRNIPYIRQDPSIKGRWPDKLVRHELKNLDWWLDDYGVLNNKHERDAVRHLLHAYFFRKKLWSKHE